MIADSVATNAKRRFMHTGRRLFFCLVLVAAAALAPASIVAAETMDSSYWAEAPCYHLSILTEFFDGVMPPVLPAGWSSTTWVTSNSGVPMPPADTLPNAAFVDDPATISDKQLLSPTITLICDAGTIQVSFRNNFNFQDGFDGGVLEVSYDGGSPFRMSLLPVARSRSAVTMARSTVAVAILWLVGRRGLATRLDLSTPL